MKDTKLIIITGMSGVGKSTTAQNIAQLYEQNKINYYWYHEEIKDHPIRWANGGEFNEGSLYTEEGMDRNIRDMYERWGSLIENILATGGVHIMEGCLFQNIIRYFFAGDYPRDKIILYYNALMKILEPANPHIIFLYRPNVRENLEKAFQVRGNQWKDVILNREGRAYFESHKYIGDESIFSMWEDYQGLADEIFNIFHVSKIKIDTSGEQWDSYLRTIADYMKIKYYEKKILQVNSLDQYCGEFFINDKDGDHHINIIKEGETLYFSPPWFTHIKLIPLGNDEFDLLGFPIKLRYSFTQDERFVRISGNYDWNIMGKTLKARKE